MRSILPVLVGGSVLAAAAVVAAATIDTQPAPVPVASAATATKPNVVVVMTDDQTVADLSVMPRTKKLIGDEGVTFGSSYVSYPLCCPSRTTLQTGQYAHNHGVEGNAAPNGGFARFKSDSALPVWLSSAGYTTGHIGKFLNGYGRDNPTEIPPGWTEWYGSTDPSTYSMWGYTLNENGVLKTYGSAANEDPALYQTDVYKQKAVDFVQRRAPESAPFYLSVAFLAPHTERQVVDGVPIITPGEGNPRPAPRHNGAFANEPLPRDPGFNEPDVSDKPTWVRGKPVLGDAAVNQITANYRSRREALLSVDEAVEGIVGALRDSGELDNTYIVFTSDNGYFQGQHRIPQGKYAVYEPSTAVPLLMTGPSVRRDARSNELVANIDLAPTILDVTGASAVGVEPDGRSLMPFARDPQRRTGRPLLHEALQAPDRPAEVVTAARRNYHAIRTTRYVYVEYFNGDRELYDLRVDPYQLRSVHDAPQYSETVRVLDRQLDVLKACSADSCRAARSAPPGPR